MSTEGAAITQGSYADFKLVKTRKVAQVVVEIPIEHAADFIKAFGVPDPSQEIPVAIARLNQEGGEANTSLDRPGARPDKTQPGVSASVPASAPGAKRHFSELPLSQQAALMCGDRDFQFWLGLQVSDEYTLGNERQTANHVRGICGVDSRSEFDRDDVAAAAWHKLYNEFRASQLAEQHGAH